MKKLLIWTMVLSGIMLGSCTKDDDSKSGSIYGIVAEEGTAEPIRGVSVVLYQGNVIANPYKGDLDFEPTTAVSRSTTYDDGHFEFTDLKPNKYLVEVENSKYYGQSDPISVESGRQTKVDILVVKMK